MMCRCGRQTVAMNPQAEVLAVFVDGTSIIRPSGPGVRVEHFDCGSCEGYIMPGFVAPGGLPGTEDCGCRQRISA